jgi:hypothetical protein
VTGPGESRTQDGTDTAGADDADLEPGRPVTGCGLQAGRILAGRVVASGALPGPMLPGPMLAGPMLAGPMLAGPMLAGPILADRHPYVTVRRVNGQD